MTADDLPPPLPLPGEGPPARKTPATHTHGEAAIVASLLRLDGGPVAYPNVVPRPLYVRIGRGVGDHFKLRVSEWFAAALLLQFGAILYFPPNVFPGSPGFSVMAKWASEETWGLACLGVALVRLAALTVNGTFTGFRWSPHVRAMTAMLACFVWLQIVLAIWKSGAALTGLGTYRLVLALEFWNFVRACLDTGRVEGRRAARGR